MNKQEMENKIIEGLRRLLQESNEYDDAIRELYERGDEDMPFLYNGYVYETDVRNVICNVLFGHELENYKLLGHNISTYEDNCNNEEHRKINKVMEGLLKMKYIKLSRSGAMVKVNL